MYNECMTQINQHAFRLNALQIESIVDRIVPLIAAPADHGFFRGVIQMVTIYLTHQGQLAVEHD